jgi:hypothetical protein
MLVPTNFGMLVPTNFGGFAMLGIHHPRGHEQSLGVTFLEQIKGTNSKGLLVLIILSCIGFSYIYLLIFEKCDSSSVKGTTCTFVEKCTYMKQRLPFLN